MDAREIMRCPVCLTPLYESVPQDRWIAHCEDNLKRAQRAWADDISNTRLSSMLHFAVWRLREARGELRGDEIETLNKLERTFYGGS